jgi:hypothetical protein
MLALSFEGFSSSPALTLDHHQLFLPLPLTSMNSVPSVLKSTFNNTTPHAPAAGALCETPQPFHSIGLAFPLLSYSYALFCLTQNTKRFIFKRFRTLCQKHPGWGMPPRASSAIRCPLFTTHGSPQNFYPPAPDLRHNPAAQGHTSVRLHDRPHSSLQTGRIQ